MFEAADSVFALGADQPNSVDTGAMQPCTLDTLWPRPHWQQEIRNGMHVDVAAMIDMIRAGLGREPKSGTAWDIPDAAWREAYAKAVPLIRDVLMTSLTVFEVTSLNSRLAAAMGTSLGKIGRSHPSTNMVFWAAGRGITRLISPGSMTLQQQVLGKWLPKLGWPHNEASLHSSVVPLALTDGGWRVVKVEGNRYRVAIANTFDNEAQALSAAIGISNRHVSLSDKKSRSRADVQSILRDGPAYRQGRTITTAILKAEFGFRDVEFGRTVGKNERQLWLDGIFDAYSDLSDVLVMPRRWIGLGGVLLAIGVRASATESDTFELAANAIHLTKTHGAGTLAYQWWLAADFRLNNNTVKSGRYLSSSAAAQSFLEELSPRATRIVEQIREIHRYIIPASDFHVAARNMNRLGHAGIGWDRPERLFARAFEAYVQDKLLESGRMSPWLVSGTLASDYGDTNCLHPHGYERVNLNILFDMLMRFLIAGQ